MLSAADDSAASIDTWINVHAVVMLAATAAVFLLDSTIPVAAAALASFAYLLIRRGQTASKRKATGRYAHQLTLLRLLLPFSCKRRGFCPSCGARRMAETAALLVDDVLPQQPVRQWVLSLPAAIYLIYLPVFFYRPAVNTSYRRSVLGGCP